MDTRQNPEVRGILAGRARRRRDGCDRWLCRGVGNVYAGADARGRRSVSRNDGGTRRGRERCRGRRGWSSRGLFLGCASAPRRTRFPGLKRTHVDLRSRIAFVTARKPRARGMERRLPAGADWLGEPNPSVGANRFIGVGVRGERQNDGERRCNRCASHAALASGVVDRGRCHGPSLQRVRTFLFVENSLKRT